MEEKGDMIKAKSDVEDVMMDLSKDVRVRSERELPMDTSVAEMTPVSSSKISTRVSSRKLDETYIQTTIH